jgi:signal recognition particle subunit SRP68
MLCCLTFDRCLTIGDSHAISGESKRALALYARSHELSASALSVPPPTTSEATAAAPKFEISTSELNDFHQYIQRLLTQFRALVELKSLADRQKAAMKDVHRRPLAERLDEYPIDEIDLSRLVNFPPELQPIPVKPLFFDLAWNYIDYPGRSPSMRDEAPRGAGAAGVGDEKGKPAQRGWFGFGR